MINVTRKRLSWALVGLCAVVLFGAWLSKPHTKYPKVTRAQFVYDTLRYSVDSQLALAIDFKREDTFWLPMAYFLQEHPVTCEVSALRTVLGYHGTFLSEIELIRNLAFSERGPMSSSRIWGDPDEGFVGDVNGSIYKGTGYGVYEGPIKDLAQKYHRAEVLADASLENILSKVKSGSPVISWGLLRDRNPLYWLTNKGKVVKAYPGEHARVVIGYTGEITNPDSVILVDPIYGLIRMSADKFVADAEMMGDRAVVVYK